MEENALSIQGDNSVTYVEFLKHIDVAFVLKQNNWKIQRES
jgi:hypothetical protein